MNILTLFRFQASHLVSVGLKKVSSPNPVYINDHYNGYNTFIWKKFKSDEKIFLMVKELSIKLNINLSDLVLGNMWRKDKLYIFLFTCGHQVLFSIVLSIIKQLYHKHLIIILLSWQNDYIYIYIYICIDW